MDDRDYFLSKVDYKKSIRQHKDVFGKSYNWVVARFKKYELYEHFISISRKWDEIKYSENVKICPNCCKEIPYKKRFNRFCCGKCSSTYIQRENPRKYTDEQKKVYSDSMLKHYSTIEKVVHKKICLFCDNEFKAKDKTRKFCCKKCSNLGMNSSNNGGYREKSGCHGKMGWYKGYFCNSSWELAWVIYSLEHGIKFERNKEGFEYVFGGKTRKYYPDFILEDGSYVEIKGYETDQWKEKLKQFTRKMNVVSKNKMIPILEYVKERYGNNFLDLYEQI